MLVYTSACIHACGHIRGSPTSGARRRCWGQHGFGETPRPWCSTPERRWVGEAALGEGRGRWGRASPSVHGRRRRYPERQPNGNSGASPSPVSSLHPQPQAGEAGGGSAAARPPAGHGARGSPARPLLRLRRNTCGGQGCREVAAPLRGSAGWLRSRPNEKEKKKEEEEERKRKEQEGSGEVVPCPPRREPEPWAPPGGRGPPPRCCSRCCSEPRPRSGCGRRRWVSPGPGEEGRQARPRGSPRWGRAEGRGGLPPPSSPRCSAGA